MIKLSLGAVGAALLFALTGTAANAVLFNITAASFTPGSGYGTDANEAAPDLLDVVFSTTAFSAQMFSLNNSGEMHMFDFGTVRFQELSPIDCPAECDGLGVLANFTFTNPLGSTEMVTAVGTAVAGTLNDAAIDYSLTWTPITVPFGVGGSFDISLDNVSFSCNPSNDIQCPATKTLMATIKLRSEPDETTAMPEPGALALFGLGLVGLGMARRRSMIRAGARHS